MDGSDPGGGGGDSRKERKKEWNTPRASKREMRGGKKEHKIRKYGTDMRDIVDQVWNQSQESEEINSTIPDSNGQWINGSVWDVSWQRTLHFSEPIFHQCWDSPASWQFHISWYQTGQYTQFWFTHLMLQAKTLCHSQTQSNLCCPPPSVTALQKHNSIHNTPYYHAVCLQQKQVIQFYTCCFQNHRSPNLSDLNNRAITHMALTIVHDPGHPLNQFFTLLWSGCRYRTLKWKKSMSYRKGCPLCHNGAKFHNSVITKTHYVFCTNIFVLYVVVHKCIIVLEAHLMHTLWNQNKWINFFLHWLNALLPTMFKYRKCSDAVISTCSAFTYLLKISDYDYFNTVLFSFHTTIRHFNI